LPVPQANQNAKPKEQANILLVDDRPESLLALEGVLEGLGQNLVRARSGTEALKRVLEDDYAVILLDVQMPEMDGFETASIIRQRERTRHIPIVFVTAIHKTASEAARGYSVGAVDYIFKPYRPEVLRAKVSAFVDLARNRQALQQEVQQRQEAEQEVRQLNLELERRVFQRTAELEAASFELACTMAERHKLAAIVESSEDAIIANTLDGSITSWNAGAERMYGYTAPEVTGRPISILIPPGQLDDLPEITQRLKRGERIEPFETVRVRKDGEPIQVSLTVSPIRDSAGTVTGASAIARDITPRKRMEAVLESQRLRIEAQNEELQLVNEELQAQNEELQEQNQRISEQNELLAYADLQKHQFLAMLSHELRNPLAAISNAAHIMEDGGLAEARAARLRRTIARQTRHLSRLVDDLLHVSRVTQGKIQLRLQSFDLLETVQHCVEATRPRLESRGYQVLLSLPETQIPVDGDAARVEQIIDNLLDNAGKYGGNGGQIRVTVEIESAEDGRRTRAPYPAAPSAVVIRVGDDGKGIAPEALPHIFDPFVQVDPAIDRTDGGLGIGLTLVKKLVELHGGSVEGRSAGIGLGSEFLVRFPVADLARRSAKLAGAEPGPAAGSHSLRVLVVEDNADAGETLVEMLELWGHEVCLLQDGLAVLEVAERFRPHVLLLDIGLPGMDGYEIARRVRGMYSPESRPGVTGPGPAAPQFPPATAGAGLPLLVALTGYARDEDLLRSREAGFDRHLSKPVDPHGLRALLSATPAG
jgi:PAS domain S-box-containing protein